MFVFSFFLKEKGLRELVESSVFKTFFRKSKTTIKIYYKNPLHCAQLSKVVPENITDEVIIIGILITLDFSCSGRSQILLETCRNIYTSVPGSTTYGTCNVNTRHNSRPCCRHGRLFSGTYCPVVCTIGKLIKGEYKYEVPFRAMHILIYMLIINMPTYITTLIY